MRAALGIILVLAGGGLLVYALLAGLHELRGLYEGAANDALGMSPTAEKDASRAMISAAIVGVCGMPLLLAGSVMLKVSVWQRVMGKKRVSGRVR
jgi:hypothetical protein